MPFHLRKYAYHQANNHPFIQVSVHETLRSSQALPDQGRCLHIEFRLFQPLPPAGAPMPLAFLAPQSISRVIFERLHAAAYYPDVSVSLELQGQFYRKNKTTRHPHTNMAKAALNMMVRGSTHTSIDYVRREDKGREERRFVEAQT